MRIGGELEFELTNSDSPTFISDTVREKLEATLTAFEARPVKVFVTFTLEGNR